jgi:hypothetical protein
MRPAVPGGGRWIVAPLTATGSANRCRVPSVSRTLERQGRWIHAAREDGEEGAAGVRE